MPKPKDIGLIFDVTVENEDEECKELLSFRIRANGNCLVNVTNDMVVRKMGRIVGGDFGLIKPGAIDKVSLIWPTLSLYNRVGLCPVAITSTNSNNKEHTIRQMIKFDTRFETLDPNKHTLRKNKDFVDCQNWDKEYFKNCTPVDCEERYFGLRSFYNITSEKCEAVPRCTEKYMLYDIYTNECSDTRSILSEEDLVGFKEGRFDNNVWKFKSNLKNKQEKNPIDPSHDCSKRSHLYPIKHDNEEKWEEENENKRAWQQGLGEGLLIVFATIVIYILICFSIFLFVTWLARRPSRKGSAGIILNTRNLGTTEEQIPIYTTSSLMSHR